MRTRLTHIPFFPTLARYVKTLRKDVSFTLSARMLFTILFVALILFFVLGLVGICGTWAEVFDPPNAPNAAKILEANSKHLLTWREYLFGFIGAIDAKPDADWGSVAYSAFFRLVGAIVIGGVITSFLCALVERFAEMKMRGLLVPVMRDHFVVIGYGTMTDTLIKVLLQPEFHEDLSIWLPQERIDRTNWSKEVKKRKILLCTGEDVEKIRETLGSVLPREISQRIVFAFGDMQPGAGLEEVCERLSLQDARQIYIDGEGKNTAAGDVQNLAFAKGIGEYLAKHIPTHPTGIPIPIFVKLDGGASFDFVKKIAFETNVTKGKRVDEVASYFKPFSFTEGWARRIWGEATAATEAIPLDFAPMKKGMSVHLVVAGLTSMGEALVLQAVRVCHFPNGNPSLITIVDPDKSVEAAFDARHPSLRTELSDVKIEFKNWRIESQEARDMLRTSALNENRLLTVAICFHHTDSALSAALNLPEEVYWHRMQGGKKNIRDTYRENGARIWVFQEHADGLSEQAKHYPRYQNLRPFGMEEGGFTPWCLREFAGMYLNAVYDWPNDRDHSWLDKCNVPALAGRIGEFRDKWARELAPDNPYGVFEIDAKEKKDLLLEILAEGGEEEVLRFKEYAFNKYVLLKPELRWANMYVSDSYGTVFRALGLRAIYDSNISFADLARENDRLFSEARANAQIERGLAEVEHNRWMADRALMGYRAPRPGTGEKRDDDFRYHNDMIPFADLDESGKDKDELSISCIPLFMALEGIRLEKA